MTSFDRHPNANKFESDNMIWISGSDKEKEGKWVDVYTGHWTTIILL